MAWEHGLLHLLPFMQGDMRVPLTQDSPQIATPFPYVRLRRNVALIGVSTALPQPLHRASGQLGRTQLKSLAHLLSDLRERGYARVVMIHHPPLPGLASPRKALIDAAPLRDVLEAQGAELVLHGHNHEHMLNTLNSRFGAVHVLGVPSASLVADQHHPLAAWNLYRIQRLAGKWQIDVSIRSYDAASRQVAPLTEFTLSS
jgi:3',5'-cyclic AMP phosphodiesterase CpdA